MSVVRIMPRQAMFLINGLRKTKQEDLQEFLYAATIQELIEC
jgi:hypothetical protein